MGEKLMRQQGMVQILITFGLCISGLSLLLPASPAWVTLGGASSTGAGMVTAVLMASTVATQVFCVQLALHRYGWEKVLVAGTLCMSLPSALQAISPQLWLVLASSALRGVGFGILTVCCSTALSLVVPVTQRGRAIGYYGLAAAFSQLIFTPLAPWLIETFGFRPVLVGGIITLAALPSARSLGRIMDRGGLASGSPQGDSSQRESILPRIWPALLTLTVSTAAGGAFMTFVSDIAAGASLASWGLLCMMGMAVPTRLYGGSLTDRLGTQITMSPVLLLNAVGVLLIGLSAGMENGSSRTVFFLAGSLITGAGYGFLQSVTMVRALADAGRGNTTRASVAWNSNFDIGTGLGGLVIGLLASVTGFPASWLFWGALMLASAAVIGVRDAASRPAS